MMARVMVFAIMSMAIAILMVRWGGKTRRWTVEYWKVFSRSTRIGVTSRNNTSTTWNTVRWHGYEKYCQKLMFVTEVAAGPLTLSLLQPLSTSNFSHCSLAQVSKALHTYLAVLPAAGRLVPRNNTGG